MAVLAIKTGQTVSVVAKRYVSRWCTRARDAFSAPYHARVCVLWLNAGVSSGAVWCHLARVA